MNPKGLHPYVPDPADVRRTLMELQQGVLDTAVAYIESDTTESKEWFEKAVRDLIDFRASLKSPEEK